VGGGNGELGLNGYRGSQTQLKMAELTIFILYFH
jgi:hypothetical protein